MVEFIEDSSAPVIKEVAQTHKGWILVHIEQQHRNDKRHALNVPHAAVTSKRAEDPLKSHVHRPAVMKKRQVRKRAR